MNSSEHSRHNKHVRQTQHLEVTEMMDLWVTKAMQDKLMLTGKVLQQKWAAFANLVGIPEDERLNLSEGWVTKFKEQCSLKQFKQHGEATSTEPKTIEEERKRVQELVKKFRYALHDIFNMDETGLFYV